MTVARNLKPIALPIVILLLFINNINAQRPTPTMTEVLGHTLHTVLKPGDIPAIFQPEFDGIDQAKKLYYADEPLMVITAGAEVKAYSTWHLDHHEVVNDFIGGTAIAATW